jgi:carboxymethylenebutenolidase
MAHPVQTRWIDLPQAGSAYLAVPPAGHGPGLLLLQEIFGVNEHIRAVADSFALDGFTVLVPDVFWRQAPRVELGYVGEERQRGIALASALQPAEVAADLGVAIATLRGLPEVAGGKLGAIGYCMGGRLAFQAAALGGLDAAVAYYGGGIQGQLALAAQINVPMQFHYAEHDDHIPLTAVQAVREAMAAHAQAPAEVLVYPGSTHGFNCWARASYHAGSAALARGRSLAFLAQHLF